MCYAKDYFLSRAICDEGEDAFVGSCLVVWFMDATRAAFRPGAMQSLFATRAIPHGGQGISGFGCGRL